MPYASDWHVQLLSRCSVEPLKGQQEPYMRCFRHSSTTTTPSTELERSRTRVSLNGIGRGRSLPNLPWGRCYIRLWVSTICSTSTYGCQGNLHEAKGRDFPYRSSLLQWAAVAARMADQRLLRQLMFVMH